MRNSMNVLAIIVGLAVAGWVLWEYARQDEETEVVPVAGKIVKSDAEWRQQLTPEQYHVTRKKGTERAGTGIYADCKKDGVYHCICCGQPLFDAQTKYDSCTGWPSFFKPVSPDAVAEHEDRGWLGTRTEIVCSKCDAHLGHVFPDGPQPTGLRYCMNSAALNLVERKAESAEPTSPGK
jgi:peptide-methionine (R)-S-oxide reductase